MSLISNSLLYCLVLLLRCACADSFILYKPFQRTPLPLIVTASSSDTETTGNTDQRELDIVELMNGDISPMSDPFEKLINTSLPLNQTLVEIDAPQLNYNKFITMQDKRVIVTIRYSGESNLKPYFLTVAKKLKASHPDVIIERRILPKVDEGSSEETFEVLVDGKVVVGKGRARRQKVARVDMSHARSVFVSMDEVDVAVSRARRRRRPSTTYGEEEDIRSSQQS